MGERITAAKMKKIDLAAQKKYLIPGIILMENAGLRAADIIINLLKKKSKNKVAVFCGPGNNGGDGFVVARHLINNKIDVTIYIFKGKNKFSPDALINFRILEKMRSKIIIITDTADLEKVKLELKRSVFIVDAIFGIGLNKNIKGIYKNTIDLINVSKVPVVSLDIPSGLCADTGSVLGVCLKAVKTITFGFLKRGLTGKKSQLFTGHVQVVNISLPFFTKIKCK